MHPCVAIPELYEVILGYLERDSTSLLSIGLTCRDLLEKSLDMIWKREIIVSFFLAVLPSDLRDVRLRTLDGTPISKQLDLIRELTDAEFERWIYYSKRIRTLTIDNSCDIDVLLALVGSGCFRKGALIPGLITFSVRADLGILSEEATCLLSLLLGSSIINLEVCIYDWSERPYFWSALQKGCPNTTRLRVQSLGGFFDPCVDEMIESLILSLNHLTYLKVESWMLTRKVLKRIAYLPSFTTLKSLKPTEQTSSYLTSLSPTVFPKLTNLVLEVDNWLPAIEILGLTGTSLKSLQLTACNSYYNHVYSDPLAASTMISKVAECANLRELEISLSSLPYPATARNLYIFDPLFAISKLQKLHIGSCLLQEANREWIDHVSNAFPLLESIRLYVELGERAPSQSSMELQDLIPLLHRCTRLREIDVSVVCSPFPLDILNNLGLGRVLYAKFTDCPVEDDYQSVLECILAMLPHAIEIRGGMNSFASPEYRARWERLNHCFLEAGKLDQKTLRRFYLGH